MHFFVDLTSVVASVGIVNRLQPQGGDWGGKRTSVRSPFPRAKGSRARTLLIKTGLVESSQGVSKEFTGYSTRLHNSNLLAMCGRH